MRLLISLFVLLTLASNAIAASCPIVQVKNEGAYLNFGSFKGHLISGGPSNITAWEGPLIIENATGQTCESDLSIISPPFFFAGTHYLYVTTYSGSESVQYLVDANDCQTIWSSPQFTRGPFLRHGNTFIYRDSKPVRIKDNCKPTSK